MDYRRERIVCVGHRQRIEGSVALPREGYHSRLSDYLNRRDREFIPLEDVEVTWLDDSRPAEHHPFLLIARSHQHFITGSEPEPTG